jgi:asparagine synthase (glutamine-hydrolysing)
MVEAIQHESFYVTGTWVDESMGVYIGWLALKNSFSDGMPLRNDRGDVISFPAKNSLSQEQHNVYKTKGTGGPRNIVSYIWLKPT